MAQYKYLHPVDAIVAECGEEYLKTPGRCGMARNLPHPLILLSIYEI